MPPSSPAREPLSVTQIATLEQSAASGVIWHEAELLVVADDELALARYDAAGRLLGRVQLLPGVLPADPATRKLQKRDFEALVAIEEHVLVLGSGSKAQQRDVGVALDRRRGTVRRVDLGPLYAELVRHATRLNVEGAVLVEGRLVLLTRRTGSQGRNLLVSLAAGRVAAALREDHPRLGHELLLEIVEADLGTLAGVPLGFTDGTAHGASVLFSAAAEATDDPVLDGTCAGSVLGLVELDGTVRACRHLTTAAKIEGVTTLCPPRGEVELRLVADPDDPALRAPLFAAPLSALAPR